MSKMTDLHTPAQAPSKVACLMIAHLIGGQTVIGQLVQDRAGLCVMHHPYEVLVIPPGDSQKTTVTVTKFGSMMGLVPELGLDQIDLAGKILGTMGAVKHDQLLVIYMKAFTAEVNAMQEQLMTVHGEDPSQDMDTMRTQFADMTKDRP